MTSTEVHTFVFAHGAGAPMDSPFMEHVAAGLTAPGLRVVRFEFPYMQALRETGRRLPPDRMPVLEARFRAALEGLGDLGGVSIGGKSMGGRVATRIADELGVARVAALGYPFHPPKKPEQTRVAHLATLRTPCLILQGTRDPLGSPEEIRSYALSPSISVEYIEDGDHSFVPRKQSGRTEAQNLDDAVVRLARFLCGARALA
jgi:predicted alpha/beta-hydrolase family hydrolase